jgi:uncharacterized protein (TIGR03083 family)
MADQRDPELPGRLLLSERDALLPLLRGVPEEAFALRTCCPGWTVRHVLAHCSAALRRAVEGRMEKGVFSPESNDRDIAERSGLPLAALLDELEQGMTEAGPPIAAAGGNLDGLALGEWVHAGDVREALGEPGAYGGESLETALELLVALTRVRKRFPLHAELDGYGRMELGAESEERPVAKYYGDGPTLMRLSANRPLAGTRYELTGITEAELGLFS